ncbi:hypothetical protein Sjap_008301 [Stephania japonica]|uniref:Uncharacterized protein n=1 Tax=Stephania japonica TaxID=461633 RepID=A0AAP0PB77_9MAGN
MSSRGMLPHVEDRGRDDHDNTTSPNSSTHNASSPRVVFTELCRDPHHHTTPVFHPQYTWDERLSWRVCYAWLRKAVKRYTDNVYKMVHRRHAPAYLMDEVFQNYKKMRKSDDFKEKSAKMSANRMTEKGGLGTEILLHNCGSISATEHKRTLAKITRRMEELGQTQETPIDENAVYFQVVKSVKGRVYGLGSQGYIILGASSSHSGSTYGPHENETLGRDFEKVQEEMLRDITKCRQENQELREHYVRMKALVFERFGITPSSTEPPPPPPSTDPSSRYLDNLHEDAYVVDTRHLMGDASQQRAGFHSSSIDHQDDRRGGYCANPHIAVPRENRQLLDDNEEFMNRFMPPPTE